MSQQVKTETLRKLIRDIDTEIRHLKVYSKFEEAKRRSIREKKLEKTEKIKDCVVVKDSATVCSQIKTTQNPEENEGLTKC